MALLDAALAFALTLAALATVVTIIMEIAVRFFGMKAKSQVAFVLKLAREVPNQPEDSQPSQDADWWKIVRKVLENPMAPKEMAASESGQRYASVVGSPIYTDISLEHFLRRVLEIKAVRDAINAGTTDLKTVLTRLGSKYEEFGSAASTTFKRKLQLFSILVGVGLAIFMNVDGIRLFQAYLKNPETAQKVVAALKQPNEEQPNEAGGKPAKPGEPNPATTPNQSKSDAGETDEQKKLNAKIAKLDAQLQEIQMLKLPIGEIYFPHCVFAQSIEERADSPDELCRSKLKTCDKAFWKYIPLWFLKVLVTGLLIGLGAPFWYDVARRLAEIRLALGGRGSSEQRLRGTDPKKEPEDKEKLIDRILRETS